MIKSLINRLLRTNTGGPTAAAHRDAHHDKLAIPSQRAGLESELPTAHRPNVIHGARWESLSVPRKSKVRDVAVSRTRRLGSRIYCVINVKGDAPVIGIAPKAARLAKGPSYFAEQLLASVSSAGSNGVFLLGQESDTPRPWSHGSAQYMCYLSRVGVDAFQAVSVFKGIPFGSGCALGKWPEVLRVVEANSGEILRDGLLLVQNDPAFHRVAENDLSRFQQRTIVVDGLPYAADLATRFRPVAMVGAQWALWLGLLAVCLATAIGALWYVKDKADRAAATQALIIKNRELATHALAEFDASHLAAFTAEPTARAVAATEVVWSSMGALSSRLRPGFTLGSVKCVAADCTAFYTRTDKRKTFADFVDAHQVGETPSFTTADLDSASTQFLVREHAKLPTLDLADAQVMTDAPMRIATLAQELRLSDVVLSVSPFAPLYTAPADSKASKALVAERTRLVASWQLKGPSDALRDAVKRLPNGATLSAITVWLGGDVNTPKDSFEATGRLFAAPVPVTAASSAVIGAKQ